MKLLKHPVRSIREPFGLAGVIVACVALVAALGGGAYAASGGLTGKQKKEVQKIAKAESKKFAKAGKQGPEGKPGPAGAAGPVGATGDPGAAGTAGTPGTPGAAGKDGQEGSEGPEGPEGSPWVDGGTLPSGQTETGTFSAGQLPKSSFNFMPIAFPIPLSQNVAVHFVPANSSNPPAQCPGGSWEFEKTIKPEAEPGNLCVYETGNGFGFTFQSVENPESGEPEGRENPVTHEEELLSGKSGAVLLFEGLENGTIHGVWAVTAE